MYEDHYFKDEDGNEYRYFTPSPKRRGGNGGGGWFSYVVVAVISAVITSLVMAYIAPTYLYGKIIPMPEAPSNPQYQPIPQIVIPKDEKPTVVTAVAQKASPTVVGITTVEIGTDFFFRPVQQQGVGSGFIVDPNGYILTNNHVANQKSREITVYLADGRSMSGRTLWSDPSLDMSIIKINATNLPVAEMGNSDELVVGETAVAIGNPLGLRFQRTVTSGIISALNRTLQTEDGEILEDLIQTDASINPGNSGGPLLNAEGKVVGINTAKVTTAEGLGFAIPINIAKPILNKIINTGKFVPAYMGVVAYDKEIAGYYSDEVELQDGVYIEDVDADGPAAKAGIKSGYIITEINGQKVRNMLRFKTILYGFEPGDTVKVTCVTQDNKEKIVDVTLSSYPSNTEQ
ncbi:S1C family serine protease [Calorimonas adulescens]|uniref:Trypsin-like serine protease n=1 Tax=Calorimonas adulescens TaxID=2606906 RepID=A0A5D8QAR9_9THEO|nr:trypsin-like peptidase domain-containing protein [Calorimonas adulescens]TZE80876.1 trypsin-like serine protease [Calorimonas adulescens]